MEPIKSSSALIQDIAALINNAKQNVARQVNSSLVSLYWQIGQRIRQDILNSKRAKYAKAIVPTLPAQLKPQFGSGFGIRNLFRMIKFELFLHL